EGLLLRARQSGAGRAPGKARRRPPFPKEQRSTPERAGPAVIPELPPLAAEADRSERIRRPAARSTRWRRHLRAPALVGTATRTDFPYARASAPPPKWTRGQTASRWPPRAGRRDRGPSAG